MMAFGGFCCNLLNLNSPFRLSPPLVPPPPLPARSSPCCCLSLPAITRPLSLVSAPFWHLTDLLCSIR
ncbi:unnamed protein product, partial [Closterium sp. Naga37s-1]